MPCNMVSLTRSRGDILLKQLQCDKTSSKPYRRLVIIQSNRSPSLTGAPVQQEPQSNRRPGAPVQQEARSPSPIGAPVQQEPQSNRSPGPTGAPVQQEARSPSQTGSHTGRLMDSSRRLCDLQASRRQVDPPDRCRHL